MPFVLLPLLGCAPSAPTPTWTTELSPSDTQDTSDEPSGDTATESPDWQQRSLYYLKQGRVCMSSADGTGSPADPHQPCVVDDHCVDPAFSVCAHLALGGADPQTLASIYPPLEHPPPPTESGGIGYRLRYVPLCEDGSGDHEYSLWGTGSAPTCAEADFIRCADGTRPTYYLKPGASNNWIVWAGQGGFSVYHDTNAWVFSHREGDSFGQPRAPSNQHTGLHGIFTNDEGGTAFNDYTRVRVSKCTPDRWLGRSVQTQTSAPVDCALALDGCTGILEPPLHDSTTEFDVWLHGDRVVTAVLADLATGPNVYDNYHTDPPRVAASAPPLRDADQILLTCWSNGCNGMHMALDRRAGLINTFAQDADVRAVFNNFFVADLEGEWAIDESNGEVVNKRSWYDHVTTGSSIAHNTKSAKPVPISPFTYEETGSQRLTLDMYNAELDDSCLAFHADDPTPCYSGLHVLANHLQHPFFYNLAQTDGTLNDGGRTTAPYCEGAETLGEWCDFSRVKSWWQHMVRKQAADLHLHAETDRCEAASGPGPYAGSFIWAPNWDNHGSWAAQGPIQYAMGPGPDLQGTLRQWAWLWASDVIGKGICLEEDASIDASATYASLGVPECVGPTDEPAD